MKRDKGEIELDEGEIRWLWRQIYGADIPEELPLKKAAESCLLELGAGKIEKMILHRFDEGFDPSD